MLQFSAEVLTDKISKIEATIGQPLTLRFFVGPIALETSDPETGAQLSQQVLPTGWLASAASAGKTKTGPLMGTYAASGLVAGFRITDINGVAHVQGLVGATGCAGDMTVSNVNAKAGESFVIDTFTVPGSANLL